MGAPAYSQGEVLLAWLVFSDGQGTKRRPVLVVQDFGDDDLLVVPVTSHPGRTGTDVVLRDWKAAGLKLPSTVRVEKLGTIEESCVARRLGKLTEAELVRFKRTSAWRLQPPHHLTVDVRGLISPRQGLNLRQHFGL